MRVGSEQDFIELIELERVLGGLPCSGDVAIYVGFGARGFAGVVEETWLGYSDVEQFLDAIESLEKSGVGAAKISSLIPEEFSLEIRSIDKQGHILIQVELGSGRFIQSERQPLYFKGAFEIGLSTMVELKRCFTKFISYKI